MRKAIEILQYCQDMFVLYHLNLSVEYSYQAYITNIIGFRYKLDVNLTSINELFSLISIKNFPLKTSTLRLVQENLSKLVNDLNISHSLLICRFITFAGVIFLFHIKKQKINRHDFYCLYKKESCLKFNVTML